MEKLIGGRSWVIRMQQTLKQLSFGYILLGHPIRYVWAYLVHFRNGWLDECPCTQCTAGAPETPIQKKRSIGFVILLQTPYILHHFAKSLLVILLRGIFLLLESLYEVRRRIIANFVNFKQNINRDYRYLAQKKYYHRIIYCWAFCNTVWHQKFASSGQTD